MPGPAALAVPGAMLAMKRLAFQASAYYSPEIATAVTSATLVAMFAKWIWKWIPSWIKEDISFQTIFWFNYKSSANANSADNRTTKEEENREELTHLASVLQSFHRMTQSMEELYQIPQLHAAILAYIKWSRQMKELQLVLQEEEEKMTTRTLTRDYGYETAGHPLSLKEHVQTPEHQQALEFATWAYHRDSATTTTTTTATTDTKKRSTNTSKLTSILQERDYELVYHDDQSTRPGHVAFYVAVSGIHRQVIIGIRGTSTLEDLVTDCCGHAAPLRHEDDDEERGRIEVEAERPHEVRLLSSQRSSRLSEISLEEKTIYEEQDDEVEIISGHERIRVEDDDSQGDNHIRCHEGILLSAQRMVKKIRPVIQDWAIDAGYQVLLCGHSLGGGAATLAALILRAQFPELEQERRLQVYAFGPPPVLDHDSAIAAAPFVTSFVHNADMISRCSLFNLAILLKGLKCIHERLKERGMNPTGPKTTAVFIKQLFSSHKHSKSDSDDDETEAIEEAEMLAGSSDNEPRTTTTSSTGGSNRRESSATTPTLNSPLLTLEEWRDSIEEGTPEIRKPEHLFVAGRVFLIYSPWKEEAEGQHHNHNEQNKTVEQREEEGEDDNDESSTVLPVASRPLRCVETDGTSLALRTIEADSPRLFTDHVTSSYFEALGMEYHFE